MSISPAIHEEEKFFDPENPSDSRIDIRITTDSRQSGRCRLSHLIAQLLVKEGFTNVNLTSLTSPGTYESGFLGSDCGPHKEVTIYIDDDTLTESANAYRSTYRIEK